MPLPASGRASLRRARDFVAAARNIAAGTHVLVDNVTIAVG
jgi:hypothetical protein